ncbi:MAG: hypothetical protein ACLU7D_10560 [Collinsella sp.]
MNSDAKLRILIEALAAAGASALAIDGHGHVAISTMDDASRSSKMLRGIFVAERLGRVGDGAGSVMGACGRAARASRCVPVAKEYGARTGSRGIRECARCGGTRG